MFSCEKGKKYMQCLVSLIIDVTGGSGGAHDRQTRGVRTPLVRLSRPNRQNPPSRHILSKAGRKAGRESGSGKLNRNGLIISRKVLPCWYYDTATTIADVPAHFANALAMFLRCTTDQMSIYSTQRPYSSKISVHTDLLSYVLF